MAADAVRVADAIRAQEEQEEEKRLWASVGFGDPYAMAQADLQHTAALEGAITGLARKAGVSSLGLLAFESDRTDPLSAGLLVL